MTNCGAASESCCTSLEVTGGTYYRTYTNSGSGPMGEADPATVSGLRIDKYDVTVRRFRQFVSAWNGGPGYTPPSGSGIHTHVNGGRGLANSGSAGTYETGWSTTWNSDIAPTNSNLGSCSPYSTWTDTAGSQENLPIDCTDWYEAYAFCIWDGGFLPSEAEWEYAAAGGSKQREYPWGSTAPGMASQYAIYDCDYPNGSGGPESCVGVVNIAPVGTATKGAGLWGQVDMAGELSEWNLDWYAPYVEPCTDCAYLLAASDEASSAPAWRVIRGGYFQDLAGDLVSPERISSDPSNRLGNVVDVYDSVFYGFRCARTP